MLNVVLPQAPGFNVGMAAVDLGLLSASRKLDFEFVPWRIGCLSDKANAATPSLDQQMDCGIGPAHMIRDDWPSGLKDPVLYWGDFHHMASYVHAVGTIIGHDLRGQTAARRYLLLDGVSNGIRRSAASFGTTLIFNSIRDFMTGEYSQALEQFLVANSATFFRDPISTQLVRRLRPEGGISTGVDPALILDPKQIPTRQGSSGALGIFFGRSSAAHAGLDTISRRLAAELDVPREWLDWGDSRGFPFMFLPEGIEFIEAADSGSKWGGGSRAMDALSHLASCTAVVTDSYHCALISWRLGIPAVTVTAPVDQSKVSVNSGTHWAWRDKRELAASQYGALDFVVRSEELIDVDGLNARIDHILDLIRGELTVAHIREHIEAEVEISLRALADQVEGI